ncbi:MAG: homogentisate 1,2-dioxygenase, partial [Flavobacteriales bacterium]
MPFYHQLGNIPPKRHTVHEKPGGGMYYEQLFGTEGFHGMSSLLYHVHRPTMIQSITQPVFAGPVAAVDFN